MLLAEGPGVGQEQDEVAEGLGLGAELKNTKSTVTKTCYGLIASLKYPNKERDG